MTDKNYISIEHVDASQIERFSSGLPELDWLYDVSEFGDGKVSLALWGMPVGKISTWVGEGGVGKSRLAIDVARRNVASGSTVLYFQNEVDLSTFASWVKDNKNLPNLFCSEVTSLAKQLKVVEELAPQLVFVDSINLINEFAGGTAANIKEIIDGFRKIIKTTKSHVVFLCQLNKDGSAKGSSALGHLPDTSIILTNTVEDGVFKVAIGKKNRYGRTGSRFFGLWKHTGTGVECISTNREQDERWCATNGLAFSGHHVSLEVPNMKITNSPMVDFGKTAVTQPSAAVLDAVRILNAPETKPGFWSNLFKDTFRW